MNSQTASLTCAPHVLLQVPHGRNPSDKLDLRGKIRSNLRKPPPSADECYLCLCQMHHSQTPQLKLFLFNCVYEKTVALLHPKYRHPTTRFKTLFVLIHLLRLLSAPDLPPYAFLMKVKPTYHL